MKETPALDKSLQRLEEWLRKNRIGFWNSLAPGATPKEFAACEKRMGTPFPDGLRTLLCWRNGQSEESRGYFQESWLMMGTEWIADAKTELDAREKEISWPQSWIPFLDNDQGDFLCLDASRAEAPVCAFWLGNDERPVVAESLPVWMDDFVQRIENGEYVEDDERGRFMRTT